MAARRVGVRLGTLAGLALLAGCGAETSSLAREDFDRLRADLLRSQQALQKGQSDLRAEIQQGDARTAQILSDLQQSVARLQGRVDDLNRDGGQIQGRLDELRKRVDLLSLQLDVAGGLGPGGTWPSGGAGGGGTGRSGVPPGGAAGASPASGGPAPGMAAPPGRTPGATGPVLGSESGGRPGGGGGGGGATSGSAVGAGASPPTPPPTGVTAQRGPTAEGTGSDLYQIAYIDYTKGNYNLAIAGFREFLRLSPTSELAEKAQYWIGESHFSQARLLQSRGDKDRAVKEFEQAVQAFRQVYVDHPRGDRVPAAAYKEALSLLEVAQPALAVARLQWLVDSYPYTEEAAKAREDLARIKKQ